MINLFFKNMIKSCFLFNYLESQNLILGRELSARFEINILFFFSEQTQSKILKTHGHEFRHLFLTNRSINSNLFCT